MARSAADSLELPLLQDAQQLGLHARRQFSHLVQEHGAAGRLFQLAAFLHYRAGERALFVAEQLAFQQRFGERGAVDGHKRLRCARAVAMDGARHQFLAGAAFAAHQHRGHGGRRLGDEIEYLPDARARAHHIVLDIDFGFELVVFLLQPLHQHGRFQRRGRNPGDAGEQLQVVFFEAHAAIARIQVDHAQHFLERDQGHGQRAR